MFAAVIGESAMPLGYQLLKGGVALDDGRSSHAIEAGHGMPHEAVDLAL